MNKEIFRILKEINSLDQKLKGLDQEISLEQNRYNKAAEILDKKKEELSSIESSHQELRKQLQLKENELDSQHKVLENSQTKLAEAASDKIAKSLEQQIEHASSQIEELDIELLELMGSEEEMVEEITRLTKYVEGAPKGLDEIQMDIDQENQPRKKEVDNYKSRSANLFEQLPEQIRDHFQNLINSKLPKSTVTQLDDKNYCAYCGTQIEGPTVTAIETQLQYKSCGGCKRVIIPASSLYL